MRQHRNNLGILNKKKALKMVLQDFFKTVTL
jgi:hypothetical protein